MRQRIVGLGFTAALLTAVGCQEPDFNTDLDDAGPPAVVTVTVSSEAAGGFELATWCTADAEANVSELFCPTPGPVTDAVPLGWVVRVVFDELLDPAVEDIVDDGATGIGSGTLAVTQPVSLACDEAAVPYDGFYDPSGNHLTYPPGPALVVFPSRFVATSSACEVSVQDTVVDRDGQPVDLAGRGPWTFAVAPLGVAGTDPPDGATEVDPAVVPVVAFNAPIDEATLDGRVSLDDGTGPVPASVLVSTEDPTLVLVVPEAPLAAGTAHIVAIQDGIADVAGGALHAPLTFGFTTAAGR